MKNLRLYPEVLLALYTIKCIIIGNISIGDSIAYIGIAAFVAYNQYVNKQKVTDLEKIQKDISDLKNSIQGLKLQGVSPNSKPLKSTSWSGQNNL